MSKFLFEPTWKRIGQMVPRTQDQIKKEPMLFSADFDYAYEHGGPITKEFLYQLRKGNNNWVIDSRVHMLMPGWYPCIPGWHHDDIPRTRTDGQPQYKEMTYHSDHVMAVVGDASLTEFLDEPINLSEVKLGKIIYKEWNNTINKRIKKEKLKTKQINELDIISFDAFDFHRGMPANKNGWRFFIRASRNTTRPILNETRNQVQIYMGELEAGW